MSDFTSPSYSRVYKDYDGIFDNSGFQTSNSYGTSKYFDFAKQIDEKYDINTSRSTLDRVLDGLSVGQYATMGALYNITDRDPNTSAIQGFAQGLEAGDPFGRGRREYEYSFSDVLTNVGWEPKTTLGKIGKFAVSLGGDIFLDPLTYITFGTASILKGTGTKVAKAGEIVSRNVWDGKKLASFFDEQFLNRTIQFDWRSKWTDADLEALAQKINHYSGVVDNNWKYNDFDKFGAGVRVNNKYGLKIVNDDVLRKFGDATVAPYFNALVDSAISNPLLKKISKKVELSDLVRRNPENAVKSAVLSDILEGIYPNLNRANADLKNIVAQSAIELSPDMQELLTKSIESGYDFYDVLKYNRSIDMSTFNGLIDGIDNNISKLERLINNKTDDIYDANKTLEFMEESVSKIEASDGYVRVDEIKTKLDEAYNSANKLTAEEKIRKERIKRLITAQESYKRALVEFVEKTQKINGVKIIKDNGLIKYADTGFTKVDKDGVASKYIKNERGDTYHQIPIGFSRDKDRFVSGDFELPLKEWVIDDLPVAHFVQPKESLDEVIGIINSFNTKTRNGTIEMNKFLRNFFSNNPISKPAIDQFGFNMSLSKQRAINAVKKFYEAPNSDFMRNFIQYQADSDLINKLLDNKLPHIKKEATIENIVQQFKKSKIDINDNFKKRISDIKQKLKDVGDDVGKKELLEKEINDLKNDMRRAYYSERNKQFKSYASNPSKLKADFVEYRELNSKELAKEFYESIDSASLPNLKKQLNKEIELLNSNNLRRVDAGKEPLLTTDKIKALNERIGKFEKINATKKADAVAMLRKDYKNITDNIKGLARRKRQLEQTRSKLLAEKPDGKMFDDKINQLIAERNAFIEEYRSGKIDMNEYNRLRDGINQQIEDIKSAQKFIPNKYVDIQDIDNQINQIDNLINKQIKEQDSIRDSVRTIAGVEESESFVSFDYNRYLKQIESDIKRGGITESELYHVLMADSEIKRAGVSQGFGAYKLENRISSYSDLSNVRDFDILDKDMARTVENEILDNIVDTIQEKYIDELKTSNYSRVATSTEIVDKVIDSFQTMLKDELRIDLTDEEALDFFTSLQLQGKFEGLFGVIDDTPIIKSGSVRDVDYGLQRFKDLFGKKIGTEITDEDIIAIETAIDELAMLNPESITNTKYRELLDYIPKIEKSIDDITKLDLVMAKQYDDAIKSEFEKINRYQLGNKELEQLKIDVLSKKEAIKTMNKELEKMYDDYAALSKAHDHYNALYGMIEGDKDIFIKWHNTFVHKYRDMAVAENIQDMIMFYAPHLVKDKYRNKLGIALQSIFSHAIGTGPIGKNVHQTKRFWNISIEDFNNRIVSMNNFIDNSILKQVDNLGNVKESFDYSRIFYTGENPSDVQKMILSIRENLIAKIKDIDISYAQSDRIAKATKDKNFIYKIKRALEKNEPIDEFMKDINDIIIGEIKGVPDDLFEVNAAKAFLARGLYSNKMVFSKEINDQIISLFSSDMFEVAKKRGKFVQDADSTWLKPGESFYMTSYDFAKLFGTSVDANRQMMMKKRFLKLKKNIGTSVDETTLAERFAGPNWPDLLNNEFIKIDIDKMPRNVKNYVRRASVSDKLDNVEQLKLFIAEDEFINHFATVKREQFSDNVERFLTSYDYFQRLWKTNVTVLSPSFHVGNKLGAMFNNFLDIGFTTFSREHRRLSFDIYMKKNGNLTDINGKVWTYAELRAIAEEYGIVHRSFYTQELQSIFQSGRKINDNPKAVKFLKENLKLDDKIIDKLDELNPFDPDHFMPYVVGTKWSVDIENQDRMVNFIAHIRNGIHPAIATERVNHFLFDYSQTTEFEKEVIRRVIPFWTWMKNNTALQAEMLMRRTIVYRHYAHIKNSFQAQVEEEERLDTNKMPDYVQDLWQTGFNYQHAETGRNKRLFFDPGLPINDLSVDVKKLISRLSPFIKTPIELGTGTSLYFGTPLKDSPVEYVSNQTVLGKVVKGLNVKDDKEALLNALGFMLNLRLSDVSTQKAYYMHYDKLLEKIKAEKEKERGEK